MKKIHAIDSMDCLTIDDLSGATDDLISSGENIYYLINPHVAPGDYAPSVEEQCDLVLKHPILAAGIVLCALVDSIRFDMLQQQNTNHQLLQEIAESLDLIAASPDVKSVQPNMIEKQIIYRALEADFLERGTCLDIHEMDVVLARFKRIAGL